MQKLYDLFCWVAAWIVVWWLKDNQYYKGGVETPCDEGWIDMIERKLQNTRR